MLNALVIDDSRVMRSMVMQSLKKANIAEFQFTEAEDGQDGLNKLEANEIHIAFVDWNMPNMTGIEFVRAARSRESANGTEPIPIVMVTSEKTMGKIEEALDEAGANAYICKPFTVEEMDRKLRKLVEETQTALLQNARDERAAAAQPAGGFFGKLFG